MCSGRSARPASRWIHGLSPSRSNEMENAQRLPFGHLIVGCSMPASARRGCEGYTVWTGRCQAGDVIDCRPFVPALIHGLNREQRVHAGGVGPARARAHAPARRRAAGECGGGVPRAVERAGGRGRPPEALQSDLPAGAVARARRPRRAGGEGPAAGSTWRDARARRDRLRHRGGPGRRARAWPPGSWRRAQRGGADRRAAAADPAAGGAAAVHRVGGDRRAVQGRLHHLRDVLSDLPDHGHRRPADRPAAAARRAEPRAPAASACSCA